MIEVDNAPKSRHRHTKCLVELKIKRMVQILFSPNFWPFQTLITIFFLEF